MQRMKKNKRNQYIRENYDRLLKICRRCAYRTRNKFWNASIEDLSAYGMVGVIYALDRMDYTHPGRFKYIEFYCLSHTLAGAMQMSGMKRERRDLREKRKDSQMKCLSFDPHDLARLQEEAQAKEIAYGMTEEDKYIKDLDFDSFIKLSSCQTTREIMSLLRDNKSLDEISQRLQISKRTIRRRLMTAKTLWMEKLAKNKLDDE